MPRQHPINSLRHRRFIERQEAIDQRHQVRLGLDTFVEDWQQAMTAAARHPISNRTLWLCWLQGEDNAPDFVRYCIASWREQNPDWRIFVLDKQSIPEFINLPSLPRHTSQNHIANLIRLELLARYGGVWVDATSICRRPLDRWLDHVMTSGFFAFSRPQPTRSLANWFIAAEPDSILLEAWRVWSRRYLTSPKPPQSYFWQHHTFDWLLSMDRGLKAQWHQTPQISARGPHIMQRILDRHLEADELPDITALRKIPLFKMSWKKGYSAEAIEAALSRFETDELALAYAVK